MALEKKIININIAGQSIEDSTEIKNKLEIALVEQKKVRRMIDLFILALFLVFMMFVIF